MKPNCDVRRFEGFTVLWMFEQSRTCRVKKVLVLLLFPGDIGEHVSLGPASPWSAREVHNLECASDVRRDSALLCQLARADQRRPVGILTNLPQPKASSCTGPVWSDAVTNFCTTVPFLQGGSRCCVEVALIRQATFSSFRTTKFFLRCCFSLEFGAFFRCQKSLFCEKCICVLIITGPNR